MKFTSLTVMINLVVVATSRPILESEQRCYSSPDYDPSRGYWVPTETGVEDSPVDLDAHTFGFLAKCRSTWGKEHDTPQPYWKWEAEDCFLENVDAENFCRVMKNRKGLLLVGDSLTRLMTTTLALTLRASNVHVIEGEDLWEACDGDTMIKYVRNDYLDTGNTTGNCVHLDGTKAGNTHCYVFANDDTLSSFDTLVVNSGAHPRDYEEYEIAMEESGRILSEKMRRLHGKKAIYVARNTPPGHWGCESRTFDSPVERHVAQSLVEASPESYKWKYFEENNFAFESGFSRERGWCFIDAFTPTLLRADSHIGDGDCLHYCVPGPADHWVALLYNILLGKV